MNYFDNPAISATLLKTIAKQSPAHAVERMRSFQSIANMNLGTAVHTMILEPNRLDEEIAIAPDCDKRTKAGKETFAKFKETIEHRTVITQDQYRTAMDMALSFSQNPEAVKLLNELDEREKEMYWVHGKGNLDCKAKIDMMSTKHMALADIKTTVDASPEGFMKQSANLNYHMQLAWYSHALGLEPEHANAYIIAIENTAPFSTAVYKLTPRALRVGWEMCKKAVKDYESYKLKIALNENVNMYSPEVLDLDLPAWAIKEKGK